MARRHVDNPHCKRSRGFPRMPEAVWAVALRRVGVVYRGILLVYHRRSSRVEKTSRMAVLELPLNKSAGANPDQIGTAPFHRSGGSDTRRALPRSGRRLWLSFRSF